MKIKQITLLLFAMLSLVGFAQTQYNSLLKETPGLVSYTLRNEFAKDVPTTLDKIKAMGITNVEFSNLFGKTSKELRAMLDTRGMVCTSYGTGYDALLGNIDTVALDATTLGAEFVRVAWIPHDRPMDLDLAKKTVSDFNKFGEELKKNGLEFCYHNHGYEFLPYGKETFFDYIVQNTNPDFVSFEMDILWVYHPGVDPAELLKKYPERFRLMHLKDLKKGVIGDFSGKTSHENSVVLGSGQLSLPEILKAAKSSSIKYFYIEDENPNAIQQVPLSLAHLKSL